MDHFWGWRHPSHTGFWKDTSVLCLYFSQWDAGVFTRDSSIFLECMIHRGSHSTCPSQSWEITCLPSATVCPPWGCTEARPHWGRGILLWLRTCTKGLVDTSWRWHLAKAMQLHVVLKLQIFCLLVQCLSTRLTVDWLVLSKEILIKYSGSHQLLLS